MTTLKYTTCSRLSKAGYSQGNARINLGLAHDKQFVYRPLPLPHKKKWAFTVYCNITCICVGKVGNRTLDESLCHSRM